MGEATDSKRHRVVLVEDDPLAARVAEKILERLGYVVCAAYVTGEQAVAEVAAQDPDVVLMDIGLAGVMDGVAAAKVIIEALGVPVIFLTAAVERDIMDRVAATGAAGYIQKPVKLLDLKANLEMAITRRRREQPCSAEPASSYHQMLLNAVAAAIAQPLVVADLAGQILFSHPDERLAGLSFADAFPDQPAMPDPGDSPMLGPAGQILGWVRLLARQAETPPALAPCQED